MNRPPPVQVASGPGSPCGDPSRATRQPLENAIAGPPTTAMPVAASRALAVGTIMRYVMGDVTGGPITNLAAATPARNPAAMAIETCA